MVPLAAGAQIAAEAGAVTLTGDDHVEQSVARIGVRREQQTRSDVLHDHRFDDERFADDLAAVESDPVVEQGQFLQVLSELFRLPMNASLLSGMRSDQLRKASASCCFHDDSLVQQPDVDPRPSPGLTYFIDVELRRVDSEGAGDVVGCTDRQNQDWYFASAQMPRHLRNRPVAAGHDDQVSRFLERSNDLFRLRRRNDLISTTTQSC